ncbi:MULTISPECIES: hypothetical protein [unclassified Streptomyces]|uniref:hypothetical protein n=1 Tax=unclassified Streptomyces TaxID=2593676 RepID=UPI001315C96F|nr:MULTISPECIES: hypothetical protein [unclassified Streptomyces]QHC17033.1 hypothetical protein GR131_17185 [Streptomyces sp. GF20]UKL01669.1 hypothetical protein L2I08_01445 [Streptomyces sp. NBU3104]
MNIERWSLVFKLCLVTALLRLSFPMMTKDIFDQQILAFPTWEWSLLSLTSFIPALLARNPAQWEDLNDHIVILAAGMLFYLVYGLGGAIFAGKLILWVAAAAGSIGLLALSLVYLKGRAVVR